MLAFALSCWLASAYGFLQGAWPFGVVETVFGFVAAHRWWATSKTYNESESSAARSCRPARPAQRAADEAAEGCEIGK